MTGGTKGSGGVNASGGTSVTGGGSGKGGGTGSGGSGFGGHTGAGGMSTADAAVKDASAAGGSSQDGGGSVAMPSFDWVGVVGSGQSLSVGFTPVNLTTPDPNNKMLKLGATNFPGDIADGGNPGVPVPGTRDKPWDSTMSDLTAVALVEPLRAAGSGYPRPYPINLWGETHHGAMAREITNFAPGYVTAHTVVGESGKGITALIKQTGSTIGDTGRAYAATLFEAGAFTRIAKAAGKTYGVGVVVMTHGETDADPANPNYKDQLIQLMSDYNTDIAAITGQTYKIPMYINQQHAYPNGNASKGKRPDVNNMQWQLGVDHKDAFVCTGPKYQYEANPNGDGVHLSTKGAEMLGEKTAQVYYQRAVLGNDWQPLMPTGVERTSARIVTVHFHVPVSPLNWDSTFDAPAITEWKSGKGFELRSASANITIASVAISGNDVQITASSDLPTSGLIVGYALTSQGVQLSNHSKAVRWGQLRDSDPFAGITTKQANPNYCVSFEMPGV
ncbi:MAG TPA: dockerin, partial [Polyangia bacterium]